VTSYLMLRDLFAGNGRPSVPGGRGE